MKPTNDGQEEFDKIGQPRVTEASLRRTLKTNARERFEGQTIQLSGESVGIACLVTGIDDATGAIEALVEDALIRWARLKILDFYTERTEENEVPQEKSMVKTISPSKPNSVTAESQEEAAPSFAKSSREP